MEDTKLTGKFGNNINFSDEVLSGMDSKELLGGWTGTIYGDAKYALTKFYQYQHGTCEMVEVAMYFKTTYQEILHLEPVLEDLIIKKYVGMEGVFDAVYGADSDEKKVLKAFLRIYKELNDVAKVAKDFK